MARHLIFERYEHDYERMELPIIVVVVIQLSILFEGLITPFVLI